MCRSTSRCPRRRRRRGVRVFNSSALYADVSITGNSLITNRVTPEELEVTATFDPSTSMLTGNSMQQATLTLRAAKSGNTLAEYEVESVSRRKSP